MLAACLSTSSTSAAPSRLSATSHSSPQLSRAGLLFLAHLLSPGRAVPLSRALAAGSKVCSRCGRASSCCHMWEYSPSLPYSWPSFSHLGAIAVYTEIGNVIPPTRSFWPFLWAGQTHMIQTSNKNKVKNKCHPCNQNI